YRRPVRFQRHLPDQLGRVERRLRDRHCTDRDHVPVLAAFLHPRSDHGRSEGVRLSTEILPGVFHLKQDLAPYWPGEWSAINVMVGKKIAIVDTGIPGGEALVWPLLAELGRSPSDVVAIVNSHFHGDHTGSNGALRTRTNARIMIHALDAELLGSGEIEGP